MPTDKWANAQEASSQSSEVWDGTNPLEGVYVGSKENVGPNNSMMHNITNEATGEVTGVWGSTVLDDKFSEIPRGSLVRVEFLGKKTTQKGTSYKDYSVKFFPPQGTVQPTVPAPDDGDDGDEEVLPADVEEQFSKKAV